MTTHQKTYNELAGQRVQRIEALSDGVFAIAMTLLILDIRVQWPMLYTVKKIY